MTDHAPTPHDPEALRRLLKLAGQWRKTRTWKADRPRLRLAGKGAQKRLERHLAEQWPGGWKRLSGDLWIYLPAPADARVVNLLMGGFAVEPSVGLAVRPGAVVIDIGANIGEWALQAARLAGPEGSVLAVEPNPVLVEALHKTAALQPHLGISVRGSAVGDAEGDCLLQVDAGDSALSHLLAGDDPAAAPGGATRVPLTRLDTLAESCPSRPVAVVKIDVEGHELAVLRGATRLLREDRPVLILETGHEDQTTRRDIARLLSAAGYALMGLILDDAVVEADWSIFESGAPPLAFGKVGNLLIRPR
ncbi:FkbM family methyltransferase [Roseospirillum parvum]|uniref:Methyltransferase, FkbM family n=1 Tax=Roseospirillum parvum TaxID=83401 RepID=A0A1G8EJU6_9PROT|nr:FkbM family methyltransferase [Roseospirillum parvum]SDH70086.1 methyltransferase, FkbM family [Roseospirillum parvum]